MYAALTTTPAGGVAAAPAAADTTLESPQQQYTLEATRTGPTGKPLNTAAAASSKFNSRGSTVSETTTAQAAGSAGALSVFADWRSWEPGSITVGQVLTFAGQLALQLLKVLVQVSAVVIKYALQAFIWLVKQIAAAVTASGS